MPCFFRKLARLFFLASTALGSVALAGDRPEIQQVVFSQDNMQVMVLTGWVQDGPGFSHGKLHLLETDTSRQLFRLSSHSESSEMTPEKLGQRMLSGHAERLRRAGIAGRPASQPRFAVSRRAAPTWEEGVRAGQSKTYPVFLWSRAVPIELKVQRTAVPCAHKDLLPRGETLASFSVEINGQPVPVPVTAAVPCAARYSLDRVDLSGNRVLLTVRAYTPGFEGPDALPIFLTAILH